MNRTAALTLTVLAAATVAAPTALAAPKPVTKTYAATAPVPDPTNWVPNATTYSVCAQNVPQSYHTEHVKVPAAGTLKVSLTKYQGDWDLLLMNEKKGELGGSGSGDLGEPEVVQLKLKKPGTVSIVACNWSGGPTGEVTYTFTPAPKKK